MMPLLEGGAQDLLGPLAPHYISEVVVGIVLVLLITLVMWKVVVPMFEKLYHERHEAIQGGMERAEQAQAEAQAALLDYQEQLAEARGEAARIREDAKNQGAQILAEMREQATAEQQRIIAQGQAAIEAERSQAMAQLRGEIGGLATTLAGRIVGESLDDAEATRRTVDRFIADLEANESVQA